MPPHAPDDLAARGLDMIRGAAAEPGLVDDPETYEAAVEDVLAQTDAGEHRDGLRRTLLATRSQFADAGS